MASGFIGIDLLGDEALLRKLSALRTKLPNKVLASAMRKAAKPMLAQAKINVPKKTGALQKSLKIKAKKRSRTRVGVDVGTRKAGAKFYGAFVEFGTSRSPAHAYLRPAFDSKKAQAIKIAASEIRRGILQIAKAS